ncbi:MAG: hypothetical protein RLQ73_27290 [Hoeflea sp. D1-CHI-28]
MNLIGYALLLCIAAEAVAIAMTEEGMFFARHLKCKKKQGMKPCYSGVA